MTRRLRDLSDAARALEARLREGGGPDKAAKEHARGKLTAREREVLEHAAKGLHAKEIAAALGISIRTVEVHKTRVMDKLGVRNIGELVRFALTAQDENPDV